MVHRYDAAADARYRAGRARLYASYGQHSDAELVQAVRADAAADAGAYLDALTVIAAERARLDDAEVTTIERARAAGASWTQVAQTLGYTSRQGGEQHYSRLTKTRQQGVDVSDGAVAPTPETGDAAPVATGQQGVDVEGAAASAPGPQSATDTEPVEVYLAALHDGAHVVLVDGARVGWVRISDAGAQVGTSSEEVVASSPERDLWAAAHLAARTLCSHTGPIRAASGPLHDHQGRIVETSPAALASWQLRRGRVPGRIDVVVRSRVVGWIQEHNQGYTAHTVDGPLDHAPTTDRTSAAVGVLAALWSPLELPELGREATRARRVRARPTRQRPLCPYDEATLAHAAEKPEKVVDTDWYRVTITQAGEDATLGYVRREHGGRTWGAWRPHPRRPTTDVDDQVVRHAPSRTTAIDQLLAVPGPLWADPAETTLH